MQCGLVLRVIKNRAGEWQMGIKVGLLHNQFSKHGPNSTWFSGDTANE
jgi:hypothetical protein